MNTKHALLRKETFGGTLFAADSGKRVHINVEEFRLLQTKGKLTTELKAELATAMSQVHVIEPLWIPEFNFSAPDNIFFELTRGCNLTCVHCLNSSGQKLRDELKPDQRMAILRELVVSGIQQIRFTGGEPLVVPDICQLIKAATEAGMRVSIGTNAVIAADARIAVRLAEAGLKAAIVSIDGLESKHNEIRGKGSFAQTLAGLINLRNAGVKVRVNTVVMRSNLEDLAPLAEFFVNHEISVNFRRFIPSGRAMGQAEQMLTAQEYGTLGKQLESLLKDSPHLIGGHYLGDHKPNSLRIPLPFTKFDCSAGQRGMVIWPNGELHTCGFLAPLGENSLGKLPEESFQQLWRRLIESSHISDLRARLDSYNAVTAGPRTNCLAIGLANLHPKLVQIQK